MSHRIERVNQLIRQEISELLRREVKDPRLGGLISITEVDTSVDLKYARVYVSCLGTEEDKKELLNTLSSAAGFFRNELMKRLSLRYIPLLDFRWDYSLEKGAHIQALIDKVTQEEEQA
ncbi:30S ribosome-binding factor RbfA [Chloroflexota bacterium]